MMRSNTSGGIAGFSGTTQALRKALVLLLTIALTGVSTVAVFAKDSQAPDPSIVANQVRKFGVGKAVKVRLIGGEKLSGHIRSIAADTFTIKLNKEGGERVIPYAQVAEVKDPSALTWMLIGAAVVVIIIVAVKH